MTIDTTTLALPSNQYVRTVTQKDLIVMHHTAGGSGSSSAAWWRRDSKRIATAFIVDRDGTVYQCFDPKYWAYHLGIRGTSSVDKRSIGIELANWGPLTPAPGGRFLNWARRAINPGSVYDHGSSWRGNQYWEDYPDAQVNAAIELVQHLVTEFGIDPDVAPQQLVAPNVSRFKRFKGVIAHHHVRTDKTDVSPAFPWDRLTTAVERMRTAARRAPSAPAAASTPPPAPAVRPLTRVLERGATGRTVADVQTRLKGLGHYRGVVDGDYGPKTYHAVRRFQAAAGLRVDGKVGQRTYAALYAA